MKPRKRKKTWPPNFDEQPSVRCEPHDLGWDVGYMPSAGFLTAITFLLPALIAAVLLSGCITPEDEQLIDFANKLMNNIAETGCDAGERKARMGVMATERLKDAIGETADPLPVKIDDPGETDEVLVKRTAEKAYDREEGGWGITTQAVAWGVSLLFGAGAAMKVRGVMKTMQAAGNARKAFVSLGNVFKKNPDGIDRAEEIRKVARKHEVEDEMHKTFLEEKKNGGQA